MTCPACGANASAGDATCRSCGRRLGPKTHAASGVLTPVPETLSGSETILPDANGATNPGENPLGEDGPTQFVPPEQHATYLSGPGVRRSATDGPLDIGQAFGTRYEILDVLGVGGMGAVYKAWDAELGVVVALKVIRPEIAADPHAAGEIERRFKRELLLARQVTHKNVVRIHDLGEIDGIKYITMPYIEGSDLATILAKDPKLPVARALRIARGIVSGLVAAHAVDVVHRDLKPANIMVDAEDEPTIMDFGIARSAGGRGVGPAPKRDVRASEIRRNPALLASETMAGAVVGTVQYMAPEQAKGEIVDQRADTYAFGLILYDMLIGGRRFAHTDSALAELYARIEKSPPAPRSIDHTIPPPLDAIISRCLEPDPSKRFQTTFELEAALARLDDHGKPLPIYRRIRPRTMVAAGVLVLVLLGGTFYTTRWLTTPAAVHDPIAVVIADVQNTTGDSTFDSALAQTMRRALEGASFITAYDRTRMAGAVGVRPPDKLDEVAAREIAVKQGLGVVLAGSIAPRGTGYELAVKALHSVTGEVIADVKSAASNRDQVLDTATRLAVRVRRALGDETSQSDQLFAMRSISASSLEVVSHYAAAVEAQSKGRFEDARQSFLRAVELDPTFGLAYQGLAAMSRNLGRVEDADKYSKEALRYLDSMTERERFSTRGYYFRNAGDSKECVKEYGELLDRYPADAVARSQRALCLSRLRLAREAYGEVRRASEMVPNHVVYRINKAVLANIAGEFDVAEAEAKAMAAPDPRVMMALAYSQMARGLVSEATATYQKVVALDPRIGSLATAGLGDVRIYQGDFSGAARFLDEAAAADLKAKNPDRAAVKLTSKAYAHLMAGQQREAVAAAGQALGHGKSIGVRFLVARIFAEAGAVEKARQLAAEMTSSQDISGEPQAHGKIIEGVIALSTGKPRDAIKILTDANALLDTWFGHFDLGRAYLAAGAFVQADSEFDLCITRRGEALSLVDEGPTFGWFPAVYYYQGRVREEMKTAAYADAYRQYLKMRGASNDDPLVLDVRKRIGS